MITVLRTLWGAGKAENLNPQIIFDALAFELLQKGDQQFFMTPYGENARSSHGLSFKEIRKLFLVLIN